jgi:hypothetical protein
MEAHHTDRACTETSTETGTGADPGKKANNQPSSGSDTRLVTGVSLLVRIC